MTRPPFLLRLLAGVFLALAVLCPPAVQAEGEGGAAVFDEVWNTIDESYHDPAFGGVDWAAAREELRPRAAAASSREELRAVLAELLARLGRTHFGILGQEAVALARAPGGNGWAGLRLAPVGDVVTVVETAPGGPAAAVPLGARVVEAGGEDLGRLRGALAGTAGTPALRNLLLARLAAGALGGPVGREVELVAAPPLGGEPVRHRLTLAEDPRPRSAAMGNLPAQHYTWEWTEPAPGVRCLRFDFWALEFAPRLRRELGELPGGTRGLILDLRGNPGGVGGVALTVAGLLSPAEGTLGQMLLRRGQINFVHYPAERPLLLPVALLVDQGTASTSEILAGGLQEAGRARVFGEPTAGAALPSLFRELANGDVLQYAIADFRLPSGRSIEGEGVSPDEVVPLDPAALHAGRDVTLEAALRWLDAAAPSVHSSHP